MTNEEKEFWVLAVKLLFQRIKDGRVTFASDRVPETLRALEAVKFDDAGNPIFETITGPVRALANVVYMHEVERLEEEAEEREKKSPLHDLLGAVTPIDSDILRKCETSTDFTRLAFELYKEAGVTLAVAAHCYITTDPAEKGFERNQAICAGLLIRISKFMISVIQLIATSQGEDRGEVVLALNRCIGESAVNLSFLAERNEQRFFDQFVEFSFGPERELYDLINENIKQRGKTLPVEKRMLRSINSLCQASGVTIDNVTAKHREWGGGLRERLKSLQQERAYVGVQRIPSHAVHGTWIDLLMNHLEQKGGKFVPDPSWSSVDARHLSPMCVLVLDAAQSYLQQFMGELPELQPLYRRIDSLRSRLAELSDADEASLQHRAEETQDTRAD